MAMAASTTKFLHTTFLRFRTAADKSFRPLRLSLPVLTTSTRISHHHRSRLCSTSAVSEVLVSDALDVHPWPEWTGFLEKLNGKGYFDGISVGLEEEGDGSERLTSPSYYTRVKVACLGFARERADLLRSLPKEDIQAIVECGCPNLLRKTINSAKRLRAYVNLVEGDVCSSCKLRENCNRAYVMVKKDEGSARTVDVVRLLLQYAANLLDVDSGEKAPIKESVEESVRKLLSELSKLSDTTPDPEIIKAILKPQIREELQGAKKVLVSKQRQSSEMKRGDWTCTRCNFLNYARNLQCLQCKEDGPKSVSSNSSEMRKGDWICTRCNFMNYARNVQCRECNMEGPKRSSFKSPETRKGDWTCLRCNCSNYSRNVHCLECGKTRSSCESPEMKKGDWTCPKCQFMNFARNSTCKQCEESRPKKELAIGEWECPKCNYLNFRRNSSCLKCNCDRPTDESDQYDDGVWRRPKLPSQSMNFHDQKVGMAIKFPAKQSRDLETIT